MKITEFKFPTGNHFIAMRLFLVATISLLSCSSKKPEAVSKIDTIDFSVVWINKSYLTQLRKLKSHAKLWNKHEVSWIGLAPNDVTMILVKKFWSGGGYKQLVIDQQLKLISYDQDEPDTLNVVWIEKGKTALIKKDTLIKTTIGDPTEIIETLLYSGDYILNETLVSIKGNGQVSGFGEYDFMQTQGSDYDVRTINNGLDVVSFKRPMESAEPYVAEFKGDSLLLYNFMCTKWDSMKLYCLAGSRGELKYKLVRR